MSGHKHKWVWLRKVEYRFSDHGFDSFNVICAVCQRRAWKHGKGPTR